MKMSDNESNISDLWEDMVAEEEEYEATLRFSEESEENLADPVPKEKRGKKIAPLVKCHKCSRCLNSLNGYKNHLKMHIVEELFQCGPGFDGVEEECCNQAETIIEAMLSTAKAIACGPAEDVIQLLEHLLGLTKDTRNIFVKEVAKQVWKCFPPTVSAMSIPAFCAAYTKKSNAIANDVDKREILMSIIQDIAPFNLSETSLKWFIGDFVRRMSHHIQAFFLRAIREPHELLLGFKNDSGAVGDDLDDENFQQSVYYVGGSVVRSVLKMAFQSSKEPWISIVQCIESKFFVGDLASAPAEHVTAWTESQDRGGLKFISENVWTFFMALRGLLKNEVEKDRSVLHEKVLADVKNDEIIMMLWTEAVGELSPDISCLLLEKICKFFVNAWGRGVAMKLKNAIPKRAKDKVPLRSSLIGGSK